MYTYPARAGVGGFDALVNWWTAFPWLASDLTFVGALVYMFFLAMLYGKCWIQTVKYNNPLSFIVLYLLTIEYIFLIANNQLFVQRGESLATIILFIIWLLFNKRYNLEDSYNETIRD